MESQRKRSTRSKGGRRQSIFGSQDDYERHMQSSVDIDEGEYYDDAAREPYQLASKSDDIEPPGTD